MTNKEISDKFEELELCYMFDTICYYNFGSWFKYELDKYEVRNAIRQDWNTRSKQEVENIINELYESDYVSVGDFYKEYLEEYFEKEAMQKYMEVQNQLNY